MRRVKVDNDRLRQMLEGLSFEKLKSKKPEFIVSMIIKQLGKYDLEITEGKRGASIVVEPVTIHDLTRKHIYELFRGWTGELLGERNNGHVDICKVRIQKEPGRAFIETEILKTDIVWT